jgi:hypothetical protein
MSIYYIIDEDGVIYALDATTQVAYTETGVATDNVIESGDSASDHFVNKPLTISFQGVISDTKSVSSSEINSKTPEDYINGLRSLKQSKRFVSFFYGEKLGRISNCLITQLLITQNRRNGSFNGIDSFSIKCSLKQVRIAQRALVTPFRDPTKADDFQDQVDGKAGTEEKEPATAVGRALALIESGVEDVTN